MDKKDFFISVIVCLYNQAFFLSHSLKKIVHQKTNYNYEIILVDDGSTRGQIDDYLKTIRAIESETDLDIKFVTQPDKGFRLARSRNNGLKLANGNIIIMLDGDVIPNNTLIEDHMCSYQSNANQLVYSYRNHKDIDEIVNQDTINQENIERAQREIETKNLMRPWQRVWGFNKSYTRPLHLKNEILYDEKFIGWGLEDAEFAYRLSKHFDYQIVENKKVKSFHINHKQIKDNPYKTYKPEDLIGLVNNAIRFIEAHDYDEEIVHSVLPTIPTYNVQENSVTTGKTKFLLNERLKNKQSYDTEQLIQKLYSTKQDLDTHLKTMEAS